MMATLQVDQLTPRERHYLAKPVHTWKNYVIDTERLRTECFVDERPFEKRLLRPAGLGSLDKLTPESIYNILSHLSLFDIWKLRCTSSYMRLWIDNWRPFYQLLHLNEGQTLLKALIKTGAGHFFTLKSLSRTLFTTVCEFCGEHGEFIYLLKMKRCCMRCLSNERQLLALPISFVRAYMDVTETAERATNRLCTSPQMNFWGGPCSRRYLLLDYTTLIENYSHQDPYEALLLHRPESPKCLPSIHSVKPRRPRTPAGISKLTTEIKKRNHEAKKRILERRCRTTNLEDMMLPLWIVHPPEAAHFQYLCTIHLPGLVIKSTNPSTAQLLPTYEKSPSYQCQGCAYFWNYHSPCPRQYHTLYTHHDSEGLHSALNKHLSTCIYAEAYWQKLYPPNGNPVDQATLIRIFDLNNRGRLILQRHCYLDHATSDNLFEEMPQPTIHFLSCHEQHANRFTPVTKWPLYTDATTNNTNPPIKYNKDLDPDRQAEHEKAVVQNHMKVIPDPYWDMWISNQSVSQTNWASTSRMRSTNLPLYWDDLKDRQKRIYRKDVDEYGENNVKLRCWGLDRM